MPIGTDLREEARLVGYFFKVQGYISQQQQLEAELSRRKLIVPLKAPVIVGRLIWLEQPPMATAADNTPLWVFAAIGGISIFAIAGWLYYCVRRPGSAAMPQIATPRRTTSEDPAIFSWLDEAQSERMAAEPVPEATASSEGASLDRAFGGRSSGNIFDTGGESNNGDHTNG